MTRLGRKLLFSGLAILGLLGAWGHVWFWYLPRERPRTPEASDLPARLLVSEAYDNALWIPFPHQNLGEMADTVGDPEDWLAAAARVADVPPPTIHRFGPFSVPPAREITVAADEDGRRAMVAARVYPGIALVARLAGKVAGNPWLGGGTVELDGGPARVAWDGTLWTVRKGPEPTLPSQAQPANEPLLGAVTLGRPQGLFPAAPYVLRRTEAGGFELATVAARELGLDADRLLRAGVLLALIDGAGPPLENQASALLVFDRETDRMVNLPAAAVLYSEARHAVGTEDFERQDAEARESERIREAFLKGEEGAALRRERRSRRRQGRLRMPQERLPELIRGELREGEAAGLAIVASDRSALAQARRLAPDVASALAEDGAGAALWLLPRPMLALLDRAVGILEDVPLLSSSDLQEWRDWRTVLLPLGRYERISLIRTVDPDGFRLLLTPGTAPSAD